MAENTPKPWPRSDKASEYVRIENVTKRFGDFVAVDNVSLTIFKGEIFCLLGGSGCGKTTLLRMLAGFEAPTSGRIFIDGQDMADTPPYERPGEHDVPVLRAVPAHDAWRRTSPSAWSRRSCRAAEIDQRVAEMLDIVQAGRVRAAQAAPALRRPAPARRAGARAGQAPKLLLLDEPLGALDKKLREHTQFELINIQEKLGVTFIVVTHDQEEAMTLASRIGVMDRGEIVQIGTPTEIYEYPTIQVRRRLHRLGEHVRGPADRGRARPRAHPVAPSWAASIYVDHGISAAPGATVWAAIRPEKIEISRERARRRARTACRGVVKEIAYMGDMSIYLVKIDSGKMVRVTLPNVERHADDRISWDETVWLTWHPSSPVVLTQ